jgi:RNA polymerase sigma factor (sigma-70 family)
MDRTHGKHTDPGQAAAFDGPSDSELIDRVRAGDLEAFDPLFVRHSRSALLHARHWARSEAAAEDLRAEAFTRVLYAIRNGNGPTESLRPYLLTTMRNVAADWAQGDRRVLLLPDMAELVGPGEDEQEDPVIAALERSLAGQAFMALPERWQLVLWHTEVEQEGPTQVAPLLGIEPGAVAALAYRAREGLKQAYLQAHITDLGSESCRPFAEKLGTHTRGRLGRREEAKVRRHVHGCVECTGLFAMLKYLNSHIGGAVAPAVLGGAVAAKVVAVAVLGTAGVSHAALGVRILSKARHASPRQQTVAVTTTAAVIAAAVAFAISGPGQPVAVAAPKPKPVVRITAQPPVTASPAAPPPAAPPAPKRSPRPRPTPKRTTVRPQPPVVVRTPPPPPPSPSPTPTPEPSRVMCPGLATNWAPASAPPVFNTIIAQVRQMEQQVLEVVDPDCVVGGPPSQDM